MANADTPNTPPSDFYALLAEFEKLVLDANDNQLPRHAQLPVSKRLNEVRAKLQVLGARSESAWIVEMKTGFGYGNYWGPDGYFQWVPIDKAVRFSRKEDAERVIVMLHAQAAQEGHKRPLPIEATEHEWVTP